MARDFLNLPLKKKKKVDMLEQVGLVAPWGLLEVVGGGTWFFFSFFLPRRRCRQDRDDLVAAPTARLVRFFFFI